MGWLGITSILLPDTDVSSESSFEVKPLRFYCWNKFKPWTCLLHPVSLDFLAIFIPSAPVLFSLFGFHAVQRLFSAVILTNLSASTDTGKHIFLLETHSPLSFLWLHFLLIPYLLYWPLSFKFLCWIFSFYLTFKSWRDLQLRPVFSFLLFLYLRISHSAPRL